MLSVKAAETKISAKEANRDMSARGVMGLSCRTSLARANQVMMASMKKAPGGMTMMVHGWVHQRSRAGRAKPRRVPKPMISRMTAMEMRTAE